MCLLFFCWPSEQELVDFTTILLTSLKAQLLSLYIVHYISGLSSLEESAAVNLFAMAMHGILDIK